MWVPMSTRKLQMHDQDRQDCSNYVAIPPKTHQGDRPMKRLVGRLGLLGGGGVIPRRAGSKLTGPSSLQQFPDLG